MSRSETPLATQRDDLMDDVENDDRLLLDRSRLGLKLVLAGIVIVFVGELLVRTTERPLVGLVQAINLVAVAAALRLLHDPSRRKYNLAVGFAAYAVTVVSVGAVGILAADATTSVILLVGLSLVTATLIPWSPWWQALSVLLIVATAIWTVSTVVQWPRLFWLQNVGSIAPTLAATVVISEALRRQRAAEASAERERHRGEEELRENNRKLEQEIQEHRATETTLRFALRELDHRVKNTLATVQAVAEQTLRSSSSLGEFGEAFRGRIQTMARLHIALAGRRWEGLTLVDLIELVVGPYRDHAGSISIECDGARVSPELGRVLGMALHELVTNAAKYGALSTKEGRVVISSRTESNATPLLRIRWNEHGGPAVHEPKRRGFGMKLIEDALAHEGGGNVVVEFAESGLHCEIAVPLPGPA